MKFVRKKSIIQGEGIFTNHAIPKGEIFYYVAVRKVWHSPRPKSARVGPDIWISDPEVLNYVNHSCDPNTKLEIAAQPCLRAKRNIANGEEISCDYNLTELEGERVSCTCKSSNCKGFFFRAE